MSEEFTLFELVAIAAIILVLAVVYYGWPASLYLTASVLASLFVAKHTNPWAKAALSTLFGLNIGLLLVMAILILFNLLGPGNEATDIRQVDKALLWLDEHLPTWTRLPVWATVVFLTFLTLCSRFAPQWKLVERFLWLKKWGGRLLAGMTVAASFTFFSDAVIFEPKFDATYARLTALFRDSKARQSKHIAKWLAIQSLSDAVHATSPEVRGYYHELFQTINNLPDTQISLFDPNRIAMPPLLGDSRVILSDREILVGDYIGYRRDVYARREQKNEGADGGQPSAIGVSLPPKNRLLDELRRQTQSEDAAQATLNDAERGIREIIGELVGLAGSEAGVLIDWFGEKLLKPEFGEMSKHVTDYFGKVAKEELDAKLKSLRDRLASRLRGILEMNLGVRSNVVIDLAEVEANSARLKADELESASRVLALNASKSVEELMLRSLPTPDDIALLELETEAAARNAQSLAEQSYRESGLMGQEVEKAKIDAALETTRVRVVRAHEDAVKAVEAARTAISKAREVRKAKEMTDIKAPRPMRSRPVEIR